MFCQSCGCAVRLWLETHLHFTSAKPLPQESLSVLPLEHLKWGQDSNKSMYKVIFYPDRAAKTAKLHFVGDALHGYTGCTEQQEFWILISAQQMSGC